MDPPFSNTVQLHNGAVQLETETSSLSLGGKSLGLASRPLPRIYLDTRQACISTGTSPPLYRPPNAFNPVMPHLRSNRSWITLQPPKDASQACCRQANSRQMTLISRQDANIGASYSSSSASSASPAISSPGTPSASASWSPASPSVPAPASAARAQQAGPGAGISFIAHNSWTTHDVARPPLLSFTGLLCLDVLEEKCEPL